MTELPITSILPQLMRSLSSTPNALLHAPPGAGKTTSVPPALLNAPWLGNRRILMLEPRRIAARAAARFMATQRGEQVGHTVGYRIRHETRIGPATRIEVVTEGVLTRLLQADPELADYGVVIFDEFHERSIHADLGLALCLESQAALRPDLRLLVMSATLDCAPVAALLGDCPVISSKGRSFPVTVQHLPPRSSSANAYTGTEPFCDAKHVAAAVRHALQHESGSLLVFVPGVGEIRRVADLLAPETLPPNTTIHPLYGDLAAREQDAAIAPAAAGMRKIVLATAIAETSLTIEGVRVVIDCGLARRSRFDPAGGMSRLVTERVSRAAATQRQGRAGRLEPGICYRLWDAAQDHSLRDFTPPEISEADLAPLVLELAAWGVVGYDACAALPWLTVPPQGAFLHACNLLQHLGALDANNQITPHGAAIAKLPLHPRLAHMVLTATQRGMGDTACLTAALLSERIPRTNGADLTTVLARLTTRPSRGATASPDKRITDAAQHIHRAVRQVIPACDTAQPRTDELGACLALAYPDRIAQRKEAAAPGEFRLSGGRSAYLPQEDALAREPFLAVAELDGTAARARIWHAAPLSRATVETLFHDAITQGAFVVWDARAEAVAARRQTRLGALILDDAPHDTADPDAILAAVLEGIRTIGLHCLPWTQETEAFRARVQLLRSTDGTPDTPWPDMRDAALRNTLEGWLGPFVNGITRRSQFRTIDLAAALAAMLDWPLQQRLDNEAPTHMVVPSGSRIRLEYPACNTEQGAPVLPVKLQEMFGAQETPTIANGRVALLVHLLSPAGRPLQVTQDLVSFWQNGYPSVRAEMRGRYPKHPWPEDPAHAQPTRHTKKRMQS